MRDFTLTGVEAAWASVQDLGMNRLSALCTRSIALAALTLLTAGAISCSRPAGAFAHQLGEQTRPAPSSIAVVSAQTGASIPAAPQVNGTLFDAESDGAGGFVVAGRFSCIGPTAGSVNEAHSCESPNTKATGLARILSDGSVDPGLLPELRESESMFVGEEGVPAVYGLLVEGSTVRLVGDFSSVNGERRFGAASLRMDGETLDWAPRFGKRWSLFGIESSDSGKFFVVGSFDRVGTDKRMNIAEFTPTGELTGFRLRGASVASLFLSDVAKVGDRVFVTGAVVRGASRRASVQAAAALRRDGRITRWNPFGSKERTLSSVERVGDRVIFGGNFRSVGTKKRSGLAAFDHLGRLTDWAPRLGGPGAKVKALASEGENLYVLGLFDSVNGVARTNAAAIDPAGNLTSWEPKSPPAGWETEEVIGIGQGRALISSGDLPTQ